MTDTVLTRGMNNDDIITDMMSEFKIARSILGNSKPEEPSLGHDLSLTQLEYLADAEDDDDCSFTDSGDGDQITTSNNVTFDLDPVVLGENDIHYENLISMDTGVRYDEDCSTWDVRESPSSITPSDSVTSSACTGRDLNTPSLNVGDFRESLISARSSRSQKQTNSLNMESRTDIQSIRIDTLNIVAFSSTLDESFKLNVVDMNESEDGFDEDDDRFISKVEPSVKSTTERHQFPISCFDDVDQLLPDFSCSDNDSVTTENSERNYKKLIDHLQESLAAQNTQGIFNNYDKFSSKDISFDEVIHQPGNLTPHNTPVPGSFGTVAVDCYADSRTMSPPPTSAYLRLKLVTSGSSIGHRLPSRGTIYKSVHRDADDYSDLPLLNLPQKLNEEAMKKLMARREKEKTINHNDFEGFEGGDFENLFQIAQPLKNEIILKPHLKPAVKKDDNYSIRPLKSPYTNADYPRQEPKSFNRIPQRYYYPQSSVSSSISGEYEGLYSGASLLEMFANNMDQNFSSYSEQFTRKQYAELKSRDDWIKSLNSAFNIDDNILEELNRFNEFDISGIETSSSPFQGPPNEKETMEASLDLTEDKSIDRVKLPLTATSLFSLTNERMADLFQKFSSKIYSPNDQEEVQEKKEFKFNIVEEMNYKTSEVNDNDDQLKLESSSDIERKEENGATKNGLNDRGRGIGVSNGESVSLHEIVKAKFCNEKRLTTSRQVSAFSNLNRSLTTFSDSHDSLKSGGSHKEEEEEEEYTRPAGTAELIPKNCSADDGDRDEVGLPVIKEANSWSLNNKFVNIPKSSSRRKTIRRIISSSLSKGSAQEGPKDGPKEVSISRLSWSTSLLRNKSTVHDSKFLMRKKSARRNSKFNLESGESLKGYAAEYASGVDLRIPKSSEIASKDAPNDVKRLIDSELTRKYNLPLSASQTMDSRLDECTSSISHSARSISEYVPTPVPNPKRQKSFFFPYTRGIFTGFSRNRSIGYQTDHKKGMSIRFAPTPEYVSDLSHNSKSSRRSSAKTGKDKDHQYLSSRHRSSSFIKKFIK